MVPDSDLDIAIHIALGDGELRVHQKSARNSAVPEVNGDSLPRLIAKLVDFALPVPDFQVT